MSKLKSNERLRHGAIDRLRFIDARLFWEARINRADLIGEFSVSPAQAALDFREYLKLAGRGVVYDTSAKAYVTTTKYKPVFAAPDARATLAALCEAGDSLTAVLPKLERPLNARVASRLRRSARDRQRLFVDYQSFTRPDLLRRWIAPARLVSDGERWHARSWCYERCEWRDFVLARIIAIHASEPAGELPTDTDWQMVDITLQPAGHLSSSQRASVEREFAMTDGRLIVRIPRATRIYAVRRWGLDRPDARLTMVELQEGAKRARRTGKF